MALNAGRLRHRVIFEKRIDQQDAETGGITPAWIPFLTDEPAEIVPLSVREFIASASMRSKIIARITVRYHDGMTASMRIKHGTTIYNPEGMLVDPDSGLEYVTIPCSQGVNDG